jgi:hypothetical protein
MGAKKHRNKNKKVLMKHSSSKETSLSHQRRGERATDVQIEQFMESQAGVVKRYLMQADNRGTDHLAGPFGCVFTLFDSQPWTRRNMSANSRKQNFMLEGSQTLQGYREGAG